MGHKVEKAQTSIEMKLPSNKRVTIIAQKDIQLVLRFNFAPAIFKQDNHIFLQYILGSQVNRKYQLPNGYLVLSNAMKLQNSGYRRETMSTFALEVQSQQFARNKYQKLSMATNRQNNKGIRRL